METVELRRGSELLADHLGGSYISILKVDTEGCEVPILCDLAGWLDRVDCLYYEYHSDEDRVELDRLLSDQFYIFHARAQGVHRGTVGMIAKRLGAAFPALNQARITRPADVPGDPGVMGPFRPPEPGGAPGTARDIG